MLKTIKKLGENGLSGTSKRLIDAVSLKKKTQSEIICDGDSWVFGCEIVDPDIAAKYPADTHPGAYDFLEGNDDYRTQRIFTTHLARKLKTRVTNLSWPADDNGTILRRTINYISQKYLATNTPTDKLFVIIGWSSPERNSFWYKDDEKSQLFRLWPQVAHFDTLAQKKFWELYVAYLWNEEDYITRYVLQVMQFQHFCEANNIKWMCFNSFYQAPNQVASEWDDLDIKQEVKNLQGRLGDHVYHTSDRPLTRKLHVNDYQAMWSSIDAVRFYKKDQPNNTFKSFIEDPANNVNPPLTGWHPSPQGHEAWAAELTRYIHDNNLRS